MQRRVVDFVRVGYFIPLNGPLNEHPPSCFESYPPTYAHTHVLCVPEHIRLTMEKLRGDWIMVGHDDNPGIDLLIVLLYRRNRTSTARVRDFRHATEVHLSERAVRN